MLKIEREIFNPSKISVLPTPGVDNVGKVFGYRDRIFRSIICSDHADMYIQLFEKDWFNQLFSEGLVKTWISEEFEVGDGSFLLEHQRIPFNSEPCEWTAQMHWRAAKTMVHLNLQLSLHGFLLKDSHPWNLMYYKGNPVFIDFSSITKIAFVSHAWFSEFRCYFANAIWLSCTPMKSLALEYRREHIQGFGIKLFDNIIARKIGLRSLDKLSKYLDTPTVFLGKLGQWLDKHEPRPAKPEYWSHYQQTSNFNDFLSASSDKQKFVFDSLKQLHPKTVLDCAANKGYYAAMAASLGASVAAFDYEEECVDQCLALASSKQLDITPALMNFLIPTPQYGLGLVCKNAFERFEVDVVLAMGLIHHICISQGMPVKLFCDICMRYARKGIVMEFVDPSDKHIASWNAKIPQDYSLSAVIDYFSVSFPEHRQHDYVVDGIRRIYLCLYN
jgi:hypothetical protein